MASHGELIEVLPVALRLVRIPRARVPALFHPVLAAVLRPHPVFLTITSNAIELSLFAAADVAAQDFGPAVRADARRLHRRTRRRSSSTRRSHPPTEPIEISADLWNVIQIPSPDSSGTQVQSIAAPLAAAGIPILYQSSHQNDFLFVRAAALSAALTLLAGAGFAPFPDTSPASLPSAGAHGAEWAVGAASAPPSPELVFTRIASTSVSPVGPRTRSNTANDALPPPPLRAPDGDGDGDGDGDATADADAAWRAEVRLLAPDLTTVGLPNDAVGAWTLPIVKLIAFPHLALPARELTGAAGAGAGNAECGAECDSPFHGRAPDSPCSSDSDASSDGDSDSDSDSDGAPSTSSSAPAAAPTSTAGHAPLAPGVPFFSFTRSAEGSSLSTSARALAALFPPSERHVLTCADALDLVSPHADADADDGAEGAGGADAAAADAAFKRCLQIDLRRFPLDEHGLVHRFSRVLEEHRIEHTYSSTVRTANLLVDRKDAKRARTLLSQCY